MPDSVTYRARAVLLTKRFNTDSPQAALRLAG
jgi:hypothetical protein